LNPLLDEKIASLSMGLRLRIGVDFDNTIISYDDVFSAMAKRWGLIDPAFAGRKQAVRDAIRLLPDGELAWQRLQGQVYGKGIASARMVAGVDEFLRRCRAEGCAVMIISHKTEYGHCDPDRVNLRQAARNWIAAKGLVDGEYGIPATNVFFESTRAEKLARIEALSCTHFVDDLEEVLSDPAFPAQVSRILFADVIQRPTNTPYAICASWREIEERIFDRG
jgi:hypothetical protein